MNYKIALIRGDGIGPEVVNEAVRVLDTVGRKFGHSCTYVDVLMGGCATDAVGKSYPDGTAGEDLPLEVYILGAADSYDAITSARPYCTARTPQDAGRILRAEAGKQFHPAVAEITAALAESGELTRCIPPQEETGGSVC